MLGPTKMAKVLLARKMVQTKMVSSQMVQQEEIADSGLKKANVQEPTLVLGPSRIRKPKLEPERAARAEARAKARARKA